MSATPIRSSTGPGAAGPLRPPGRRGRWLLIWSAKLAFAALLILLAVRLAASLSWSELWQRILSADDGLLVAAALAMTARFWVWQQRWALALDRIGHRSRQSRRFWALMASVLANHSTPTVRLLGGLFRARYICRPQRETFTRHYAAVLFDQLAHHFVVVLVTWLAAAAVAWRLGLEGVALLSLVLLAILVWILLRPRRIESRRAPALVRYARRLARGQSERLEPLMHHGRELVEVLTGLLRDPRLRLAALAWSVLFAALNLASQWLLFRALGVDVGLLEVAAVVGLGAAIGGVAGGPGGVGTTEAAMTAGWVGLGIGQVDAAAATLLYRSLHYLLVLGLGVPAMLWFELADPRSQRATAARPSS